jgi:hypothetical protein
LGLKILAVSGDRKIEGFMKLVGLEDWVLDNQETDCISERLHHIDSQPPAGNILSRFRTKNEHVALYLKQNFINGEL